MDPLKTVVSSEAAKKALTVFDEFKAFALKGNVVDLALGVIIGAAFAKITESLVKNIIMPLISFVMPSDQGYLQWKWVSDGKEVPYGLFLGDVLNFVIVAVVLFVFFVKFLGWILRAKKEEAPASLTKDQELLIEIRELLKKSQPPSVD